MKKTCSYNINIEINKIKYQWNKLFQVFTGKLPFAKTVHRLSILSTYYLDFMNLQQHSV